MKVGVERKSMLRVFSGVSNLAKGIVLLLVGAAVFFVMKSLQAPEIPWFAVSEAIPVEADSSLVGPIQYTVDARGQSPVYFDFSRGSVVSGSEPYDWDLEINRFNIKSNGGDGFFGDGGIQDLGSVDFNSLQSVPEEGYIQNSQERDITNLAMDHWYNYNWINHLLAPRSNVFAVRTADSRYAFLEILSYYCAGAQAGCLTFNYYYQGNGSRFF